MKTTIKNNAQSGFTLIELSIVLVIIGLIVGGVLVGQDLIRAAEIRATISQIEKYNTAVNTFRGKYNAIPGDITNPTTFGFVTRAGGTGDGDGNGLVEGCGASYADYGCETALFWRDLSTANIVDGSFATAADSAGTVAATGLASVLPGAKLGRGNYVHVFPSNGFNFFFVGVISAASAGSITNTSGLSPNQAYSIDKKVDDGMPTTGTVSAVTTFASHAFPADAAGTNTCVITSGYDLVTSNADKLLCQLQMRFN